MLGRHSQAMGEPVRRSTLGADGCETGLLRLEKAVYTRIRVDRCAGLICREASMTWGASEESVECGRMRGYRLDPRFSLPVQQEETGLGCPLQTEES